MFALRNGRSVKKKAARSPGRPFRYNRRAADYIAFDMLPFDIIMSLLIMVSLAIMPPFMAPSTAVMLSVMVSMPSVAFMSVTMVFSVPSVFEPHAETARAAAARTEPLRTLVMTARMKLLPRLWIWRPVGHSSQINVDINHR